MEEKKENKSFAPTANKTEKMVKVRINAKRSIQGYGKAGDVVEMPETLAKQYERDGYVTLLKQGD